MRGMLEALKQVLPDEVDASDDTPADMSADGDEGDAGGDSDQPAAPRRRGGGGGGVHSIESRQDAVKALQMICAYLERSEPTNPAQFLLRRAEKLIDKSFLQLVRDFAPDSLSDVARIMGVDPDSVESIDRG